MGIFGEKLRKRREQRGLSLDAISTTTKISPRMLRAIEDEHFDQLPGGVFNKGFVRAYARQIGLDEEEAISDYLAALGESQIQSQTILPNFRNSSTPEADDREASRRNANDNPVAPTGKNKNKDHNDSHHHANATVPGRPTNGAPTTSPAERRLQTEDRRHEARRSQDREAHHREAPLSDNLPPIAPPIEADSHNSHENDTDNDVPHSYPSFLNLSSAPHSSHPSSQQHVQPPVSAPHAAYKNSLPRVPWIKLISALLLITLMLALWTIHRRSQSSAALQPQPSPRPQSAPVVPAAAPTLTKPSATTGSVAARPSTASTRPAPASSAPPSQNLGLQNLGSPNAGSQNVRPQNLASTEPSTDSDVNPRVAKPHTHITAPAPLHTFTLSIRANQTCWVSISTDGQPATTETLIAPANTSVRASREINVKAGNSAGISFLLNGREIPIQGNAGEVRTFTFDSTGLRTSAPAQTTNLTR